MKPEQKKLNRSEEKYRALFENAVDAILIADGEGVFTDVNANGCHLLGYERGELIGKRIVDVLQPEDANRFLDGWDFLLEGKTQFEEWAMMRRDGSSVTVEVSAKMLPDGRLQAFARDITGRRRIEELSRRQIRHAALRADVQTAIAGGGESLQKVLQSNMESIVRHLDAAIARVWTLDGKENVLSLQASAGIYTRIDQSYSRFPVGQYKIGEIAAQKKSFFSNAILEVEVIDKQWAMREKLISFAGFPLIVDDKVVGVAGMFSRRPLTTDVLEAFESIAAVIALGVVGKQTDDALREKQQLLQTVFDNSAALIHVKDMDGRCLLANKSFENALRLSSEQITGKTLFELWELSPALEGDPNERVEFYRAFDAETLRAGRAVQKEIMSPLDEGERFSLTTKCPLYDENGKPYSLLTISTDITEFKRSEKESLRLQTELAHASRVMTMGALTSSIAHEVNQPLAGVVTNGNAALRWLAMEPPDLDEVREAVNRIIRDGIRAGEVIKRTRALLKKTPPQKMPLDINEVARQTINLTTHEANKNKILVQTKFSDELPEITGDKIQIQQVLLNLLMNGIDAINAAADGETQLSVETRRHEADKILVAVKDSGIGLVTDDSERLFESFYTTKKEGMGMGLSISRSIIEAHGGRLWATPNDGAGATFQFTLPVEKLLKNNE